MVRRVGRLGLAGALPRDLRPHRGGDADRRPPSSAWPASASPTSPPTAWSMPRSATPPSSTSARASASTRSWPRCRSGFEAGMVDAGGRIVVRQLLTAMRHQARSREIAELAVKWRDARGRRLRHRRRRGGLPADPPPRRVRVPPAAELPLHHPRRRGLRTAVDLGGDPVVRRRPARARGPDRRRHHRRRRRRGPPRPARGVRAGQADPARARPGLQRADRAPPRRSPSTRSGC